MAAGADAEGSHLTLQARSKASERRMVKSCETWKPRFGVAGEMVSGQEHWLLSQRTPVQSLVPTRRRLNHL